MAKAKARPIPPSLLDLMESKTALLLKARTFMDMGMAETAQPMWAAAASYEERIAPLLEVNRFQHITHCDAENDTMTV